MPEGGLFLSPWTWHKSGNSLVRIVEQEVQMKLALLTFTMGLFLTLLTQAQAAETKVQKREVAGKSEEKISKKVSRLEELRSQLQGYKGSIRI